jgi:hypothetical protein
MARFAPTIFQSSSAYLGDADAGWIVTKSYETALQICFVYIAIVIVFASLLVFKVNFPKLPGRKRNGQKGVCDVHIVGE